MDDLDLPNTDADQLLNRSWWTISSKLRFFERDGTYSFVTVAGTDSYPLPTDSDVVQRVIVQEAGDDDWEPLTNISDWNMFDQQQTSSEDRPTHYSLRGSSIILWPNPDKVYSVSFKYLRTLADIQASGPDAPQEWHEVILWGAISRGFFARGDWNRGTAAQNQQAIFLQTLDTQETKNQEDHVYSGFQVLRRRYP